MALCSCTALGQLSRSLTRLEAWVCLEAWRRLEIDKWHIVDIIEKLLDQLQAKLPFPLSHCQMTSRVAAIAGVEYKRISMGLL